MKTNNMPMPKWSVTMQQVSEVEGILRAIGLFSKKIMITKENLEFSDAKENTYLTVRPKKLFLKFWRLSIMV